MEAEALDTSAIYCGYAMFSFHRGDTFDSYQEI